MKKALFAVLLGLIIYAAAPSLYAQSTRTESEFYYVNTPIERIYIHRTGYIVMYRQGFNLAWTLIPLSWFSDPHGRADMIAIGSGRLWPSFSVYYQNGEFSHVRLYVRRERAHQSWGVVPLNVEMESYFRNLREIKLE